MRNIYSTPALFIGLLFITFLAYGQDSRDTMQLREVSLLENTRNRDFSPVKQAHLDSTTLAVYKNTSLAEIISTSSSVFIKSYGPGLGTISFRGTGAGQTKVYWNDVPIGSSAAGYIDFSIVPAIAFDSVLVNYGITSLRQGMGGLGGGLQLLHNPTAGKRSLEAGYALGSFGTRKFNAAISYGGPKLSGSTRFYQSESKNDYPYYNLAKFGYPLEKQKNAGGKMYGSIQQLDWQPSRNNIFDCIVWFQSFSRDIAQPMTSTNGRAWKNDSSSRALLSYKHLFASGKLEAKAAITNENLHYRDYQSHIDSRNKVDKIFLDCKEDINLGMNINLQGGLQYINDKAKIDGIAEAKKQERVSAFADYRQWINSFQYEILARQESINHVFEPAAFNIGVLENALKDEKLQIKISAGRNFNFPALNDLYWVPGGNPALKPELAYSGEAGASNETRLRNRVKMRSGINCYASDISNQIYWFPGTKGYFEAQNLKSVQIRGLELNEGITYSPGKVKYMFNAAYSYTHSISSSGVASYDLSRGKYIIYIPQNNVYTSVSVMYKNYLLFMEYSNTGRRFTTPDNAGFLPAYNLVNLALSKTIQLQKLSLNILLKCRNIFDVDYQAIQWYPMPGRYIELGLNVKI